MIFDYLLVVSVFVLFFWLGFFIDLSRNNIILKFFYFLCFIVLGWFFFNRHNYPDMISYINYFNMAPTDFVFSKIDNLDIEPGYIYLSSVFKFLGFDFRTFSLLFFVLSVFIAYIAFELYGKFKYSGLALFVMFSFSISYMIQVRQGLAISISLLTTILFLNKKYLLSLLSFILSLYIHISAVVLGPVLILMLCIKDHIIKHKFKYVFLTIIFSFVVSKLDFKFIFIAFSELINDPRILYKMELYSYQSESYKIYSVTNIICIVLMFSSCYFLSFFRFKYDRECFVLLLICFFTYALCSFSPTMGSRIFKILSVLMSIQIVNIYAYLLSNTKLKITAYFFIFISILFIVLFYQLPFILSNLEVV